MPIKNKHILEISKIKEKHTVSKQNKLYKRFALGITKYSKP